MAPTNRSQTQTPWMDDPPEGSRRFAPLSGDGRADVVVVGGGITGVTCALELIERGLSVILLDQHEVLGGETARTTAHCTAISDARYSYVEKTFGQDAARRIARAHTDALDQLEANALRFGNSGAFKRVPGYLYSEGSSGVRKLEKEVRAAQHAGLDAALVRDVPIARARGGMRLADQAWLHSRAYLKPMLERFLQLGGEVFEDTRVLDVIDGAKPRVHTPRGTLEAGAVVLATNTPLNRFLLITKLMPMRTYVVGFELTGDFPDGLFFDDAEPYHYVRRQPHRSGELLLVGGEDHKVGHDEDTAARLDRLEKWARERFPIGERRYGWSGQIIESVDELPMIGRNALNRHVFVATAYAGNGITFGTYAAQMLAELVLGREHPDAELFAPTRVRPHLHTVKEFIAENIDYPYQLVKDRIRTKFDHALGKIGPGEGKVLEVEGERLGVHRTDEGELLAVNPVCTHMGCLVHFNNAERTWDCPCHGGRFDLRGRVLNGPPRRDLEARPLSQTASAEMHPLKGEATMAKSVSAIELLQKQHREVEALFETFEKLGDGALQRRRRLFAQIADALSAHATIEEKFFYPRIHELAEQESEEADDLVREALEEHLSVKRLIADMLDLSAEDEQFDAKMDVLMEQVEHHVKEEESSLFPKVKKLIDKEELAELGLQMKEAFDELMEMEPRQDIPAQTDAAPPLS